jgi:hypothetical protein
MPSLKERVQTFLAKASIVHIVIFVLAVYSIGRNIYNYFTSHSPADRPKPSKTENNDLSPEMKNLLWERMSMYVGVSVVGLVIYMVLKHYNDKAEREEQENADQALEAEREKIKEEVERQYGKNAGTKTSKPESKKKK